MLRNYMEILVDNVVDGVLEKSYDDLCRCEICRLDVMAIALNNLKPMYYVGLKGEVYNKLKLLEAQFKLSVIQEVVKAAEQVRKNPRHRHPDEKY